MEAPRLPSRRVNVLKRVPINNSPWIKLERIFYNEYHSEEDKPTEEPENFDSDRCDDNGSPLDLGNNVRYWDVFSRKSFNESVSANSATALAFCYKKVNGEYEFFLSVVEQFRPSVNLNTLEFPSGICDPNEQICECALRELKEETGFTGVAINNSPNLPTSVLGNDNTCLVTALVDMDLEVNLNPVQCLEPTETITAHLFPMCNLLENMNVYCSRTGAMMADNIYFFCYALSLLPYDAVHPHLVKMVLSSK